jgi:hypothetical protein
MRTRLAALLVALVPLASASAGHPLAPCENSLERAGNPQCVAWYAKPGRTHKYDLGYIGGGCLGRKGEPRGPADGIFGWDYVFCGRYPGRVFLNWCHCRKQPKAGPYKTDGPEVPDIFAIHPLRRVVEEKAHHGEEH